MAGRKPFEPTEKQRVTVAAMAACGTPQDMICSKIKNPQTGRPVDVKTLRAAFRAELKDSKALATAMVAQNLFQHAMGKDQKAVTAAIFWMKCQAGWKEGSKLELTGKDGGPLQSVSMTKDEFREIARDLLDEV
ncbi:hypothetical protein SAMN05216321_101124 [Cupriavidus sp. OV038]|uniref:hypothetical protein n=1 Tax=unclassified Cupriavidus TaxID=2640874 RepID=UPI0008EE2B27|nr:MULTISPECIES: hypothetical protein [unclassified Cupriavidus]SFB68701.1 hypothetical protein SAMN05216321_101124 [Cupriavidus sp. OV038]SFO58055.1 hypothetical protein SAMN05216322_101124 [Cupriavidus sp. OV096]